MYFWIRIRASLQRCQLPSVNGPFRGDSYPPPSHQRYCRPLGQKSGSRRTPQHSCNTPSIQPFDVALKLSSTIGPDSPRRMRHLVFHAATVWLRRIAPVMFGDELLVRPVFRQFGFALCLDLDGALGAVGFPAIRRRHAAVANGVNLV